MTIAAKEAGRMLIRLAIGATLLVAGLAKERDSGAFFYTLVSHQICSAWAVLIIATLLPWIEVVAGLCLLCGLLLRGAATMAVLLGVVFVVTTIRVLVVGLGVDCGCFGSGYEPVSMVTLLRATILLLASGWLVFTSPRLSQKELVRG